MSEVIVNLQSLRLVQTNAFKKELKELPTETIEDLFSLVYRFLKGERLNSNDFKVFKIDKQTKILEFKVKDSKGNWRAISTVVQDKYLIFVYAFHKKSQELKAKDKNLIINRIRRIEV
jgi:phage-related protein